MGLKVVRIGLGLGLGVYHMRSYVIDVIGKYQVKEYMAQAAYDHEHLNVNINIAATFTVFCSLLAFILSLMCCMSLSPITTILVN